jgi:hypothetical protein
LRTQREGGVYRYTGVGYIQPEPRRQPTILAWILFGLEVVGGRPDEPEAAPLHGFEDGGYATGFPSHPLDSRVVERPLEAADVKVDDVAHGYNRTTPDSAGGLRIMSSGPNCELGTVNREP